MHRFAVAVLGLLACGRSTSLDTPSANTPSLADAKDAQALMSLPNVEREQPAGSATPGPTERSVPTLSGPCALATRLCSEISASSGISGGGSALMLADQICVEVQNAIRMADQSTVDNGQLQRYGVQGDVPRVSREMRDTYCNAMIPSLRRATQNPAEPPASDAACAARPRCKSHGECRKEPGRDACFAWLERDCKASDICVTEGKCTVRGGECVVP